MSSENTQNSSELENACVVCFKGVDIYSIGVCDHPVCYECSTRMRVLCKQNECPICRGEMPKVIFTRDIEPFTGLRTKVERTNLLDIKYGLYFRSPSIQRAYYRLLEFNCNVCRGDRSWPFKTFNQLKDHMRRDHELYYCDLCVDNLKIFAFERKCYSRSELAQHRRKGDTDNTSHRGHPLCEFCDQRYMDSDELFRHLRRDHLYCHFCDADGKHQYYPSYEDLRVHFLEEHYLCEEGDCKNEQFTSVFRTDIDLKAHRASVHSKHLSRAANKQARTLEVEFNFGPRRTEHGGTRLGRRQNMLQPRNQDNSDGYENYNMEPGGPPQVFVNPLRDANFPTLGHSNENVATGTSRASVTFTSKFTPKFNGEEFPTLGAGSAAPKPNVAVNNQKAPKGDDFPTLGGGARSITITKTSASVSGAVSKAGLQRNAQNFPTLNEATSSTLKFTLNQDRQQNNGPNVSISVNHKSNGAVTTRISTVPTTSIQVRPKSVESFPALSASSVPSVPVQKWVQPKPKKQEPKQKVAAAPALPSNNLNDFPRLSKNMEHNAKKSASVIMPVKNWVTGMENRSSSAVVTNKTNNIMNNKIDNAKKEIRGKKKEMKIIDSTPIEIIETKSKGKGKRKSKALDGVALQNPSTSTENNIHKTVNLISQDSLNGMVKKTSTLRIGLEYNDKNGNDFPTLGGKAPPGINIKPPPGFNFLPKNDLTFTNSSGQSYPILPTHTYSQPHNFSSRNTTLIQNFLSVLRTPEAMNEFKSYSDLFRQGAYPPEKYYEHCKSVLGMSFDKVFPELLVLLPNIEKQQELFKVHKRKTNVVGLEECATCKQVIFERELKPHLDTHYMENHFPSLGGVPESNNVWRK